MEPGFAAMAAAVLEMAKNEAHLVERLASEAAKHGRPSLDDATLDRLATAIDAAIYLAELIPHERLVRELVKVGALVDFPAFSVDTMNLQPGAMVLVRATVDEIHPEECRIRLDAAGIGHSIPVRRSDIIGVEKRG